MRSNTEIYIERNLPKRTVRIWVEEERGDSRCNVEYKGSGEPMVEVSWSGCQVPDGANPFIEIPERLFNLLIEAIVKHNDKLGIYTARPDELKGKLEATEKHLHDSMCMRDDLVDLLSKSITGKAMKRKLVITEVKQEDRK